MARKLSEYERKANSKEEEEDASQMILEMHKMPSGIENSKHIDLKKMNDMTLKMEQDCKDHRHFLWSQLMEQDASRSIVGKQAGQSLYNKGSDKKRSTSKLAPLIPSVAASTEAPGTMS